MHPWSVGAEHLGNWRGDLGRLQIVGAKSKHRPLRGVHGDSEHAQRAVCFDGIPERGRLVAARQILQQRSRLGSDARRQQLHFCELSRRRGARCRLHQSVEWRAGQGFAQRGMQGAELQELESARDEVSVEAVPAEIFGCRVDRRISPQRHQVHIAPHVVAVSGKVLGQLRRLLPSGVEQRFHASVLVEQLGGGLLPHSGHARQVVGRVAAQRRVLHVEVRRDAGALGNARLVVERVVRDAAPVVEHSDPGVADELVHVAVATHDQHVVAALVRLPRESGQQVVGFEAGTVERRDAQRLEHLAHQAELVDERRRRLITMGLVLRCRRVPERRLGTVEACCDRIGAMIPHEIDQHAGEAEYCTGELSRLGGHLFAQREICPIGERVPVEQEELRHGNSPDGAG